jgi:glycosyltransferase involved in cell wall biosynthesis
MTIDVSVVIPTFRRPRELREALESVCRQNEVSLEILVVDDSPEGSARGVVDELADSRITYLRPPQPTGGFPSIVRNLAWPRTTGAFIHFLDDDDRVPEGHYARIRALFATRPDIGLIFGRIEPFGACPPAQLTHERAFFAEASRRARACRRFGTKRAFAGQMLFGNPLLVCSAGVLRREAVARVNGFDPDIRLMEDADFYARIMRTCGAEIIDEVVLYYRIGFPSLMHDPDPPPEQLRAQRAGRRRMQAKYRRAHGALEFYGLAAFTRFLVQRL